LEVAPFSIPHDANDPVGYRFFLGRHSVAVATDLGTFSQTVCDAVSGSEIVLLESNHDPELLKNNPHYPARLKSRILGKKGHLSNDAGADAAVRLVQCGTKHLLLGHLSSENNTPEIAYRTTHDALTAAGAVVGQDVSLHVAARYQASFLYRY
jgi:phosphoribosyl 1,2-cyclic phosphodiesterase